MAIAQGSTILASDVAGLGMMATLAKIKGIVLMIPNNATITKYTTGSTSSTISYFDPTFMTWYHVKQQIPLLNSIYSSQLIGYNGIQIQTDGTNVYGGIFSCTLTIQLYNYNNTLTTNNDLFTQLNSAGIPIDYSIIEQGFTTMPNQIVTAYGFADSANSVSGPPYGSDDVVVSIHAIPIFRKITSMKYYIQARRTSDNYAYTNGNCNAHVWMPDRIFIGGLNIPIILWPNLNYTSSSIAFTVNGLPFHAASGSGSTWSSNSNMPFPNYFATSYYNNTSCVIYKDPFSYHYASAAGGTNAYIPVQPTNLLRESNGTLVKATDGIISGHAYYTDDY